jgi:hypothetical protein
MAQIHNVEVSQTKRYITDPEKGLVLRHDDNIQQGSASSITHDGETYTVDSDGTFDVSEECAAFLTHTPGWFSGPNPFAPQATTEVLEANAVPPTRSVK